MLAASAPSYWWTWFPGAVFATLGILGLLWKWLERVVESKRTLSEVREYLPMIAAEFHPNGGGSMRDAVNRLESGQVRTSTRLDRHERRLGRLEASVDRIEDQTRKG